MTSIAFIAGTVPLVLSHGAGAEVRSATGITVFAGMIGVTVFGLFLTPVFYVALRKLVKQPLVRHDDAAAHGAPPALETRPL
jgi:multidrug efflux pump